MPLPLLKLGLAAAAGYFLYKKYGEAPRSVSAAVNNAIDDIELGTNPSDDEIIDAGVKETFPASDPVAVDRVETAYEKQQRQRSGSGS